MRATDISDHESTNDVYFSLSQEFSTTESPAVVQKAVRVFPPSTKGKATCRNLLLSTEVISEDNKKKNPLSVLPGRKKSKSPNSKGGSVPVREVKTLHKQDRTHANLEKRLSERSLSNPEEWSGRITRSRFRCTYPAADFDAVPQNQSEPEKSSMQRSKKQAHNKPPTSERRRRKLAVPNTPESLPDSDGSSGRLSADEFASKGRKKKKIVPDKRGRTVRKKSQPDHRRSSKQPSESSDDGSRALKRRTRAVKRGDEVQTRQRKSKPAETSPRKEPLPKSVQSRWKREKSGSTVIPQDQDEDEWTKAELKTLQE